MSTHRFAAPALDAPGNPGRQAGVLVRVALGVALAAAPASAWAQGAGAAGDSIAAGRTLERLGARITAVELGLAAHGERARGLAMPQASGALSGVRGSDVVVAADAARAVAVELRAALVDLLQGRPAAALARLDSTAPSSDVALARRVLLAECYAQLGLDSAFRQMAEVLLVDPAARALAPGLALQVATRAYAGGDYARSAGVARRAADLDSPQAADVGALWLVAGLAHYRMGALRETRAALANARRAGGDWAEHAAYADAVAAARADTANPRAALDSLVALAARRTGAASAQARLTAAQIAFQFAQYEQAIALSAAASPDAAGE